MSEPEDLSGRTFGEFVLRARIGEGAFGAVYRCEQRNLGREAVVKVLHRRLRRSDAVLKRFQREAQLASLLDHPYAAHVYAFGIERDDGLFWIAMEMVHGTTLHRWLRERGPLPLAQFVPFFQRVAEVVHTAHERGIVHRDVKPSNVMVIERAGQLYPKLLDFGIAKMIDDTAWSSLDATASSSRPDEADLLPVARGPGRSEHADIEHRRRRAPPRAVDSCRLDARFAAVHGARAVDERDDRGASVRSVCARRRCVRDDHGEPAVRRFEPR